MVLFLTFWGAACTSAMKCCDQQSELWTLIFREQGPYRSPWLKQATPAVCLYFLLKALLVYISYLDLKYIWNGLFFILWRCRNIVFTPIEIYNWCLTSYWKDQLFPHHAAMAFTSSVTTYVYVCLWTLVYCIGLFLLAPVTQCFNYNSPLTLLIVESFICVFLLQHYLDSFSPFTFPCTL